MELDLTFGLQLAHSVEQIKTEIVSIRTTPASAMETDDANSQATTDHHQSNLDIQAIIADLKHDIATVAVEMREKFKELHAPPQPILFQLTPFPT